MFNNTMRCVFVIIVVHPALLNYKKNITNRIEKDLFSLERR